jgi:hypothetical protein
MPGGDGTGPFGEGPMTGRQAGYCTGYDEPGYTAPRWGFGRGGGRGRRNWFRATGRPRWARFGRGSVRGFGPWPQAPYMSPPTQQEESAALRQEANWLQERLDAISRRIEEIEEG